MANNEFVIKKGHSSRLFGIPQEQLIENGWYLTTDTAEVYVALKQEATGLLELKRINECNIDSDLDLESFEDRLQSLEADHTHVHGYRSNFPEVGEINHIYVANDEKRTYVYTKAGYTHIADTLDYTDHDNDSSTPEVRIIYGGSAN